MRASYAFLNTYVKAYVWLFCLERKFADRNALSPMYAPSLFVKSRPEGNRTSRCEGKRMISPRRDEISSLSWRLIDANKSCRNGITGRWRTRRYRRERHTRRRACLLSGSAVAKRRNRSARPGCATSGIKAPGKSNLRPSSANPLLSVSAQKPAHETEAKSNS